MTFLRITLVLHLAGVLAQSVLAGSFLSGGDGAVLFHEVGGLSILGVCLGQIAAIVIGRLPLWLLVSSVCLFMAEALQVGTGYGRFLDVHIPLGLLLFGGLACQTAWAFR